MYDEWFENKPNVFYFKFFGCLSYVKLVDEKRNKFDSKSEACVFICYHENSKVYRFYDPKIH